MAHYCAKKGVGRHTPKWKENGGLWGGQEGGKRRQRRRVASRHKVGTPGDFIFYNFKLVRNINNYNNLEYLCLQISNIMS